MRDVIVIGAGGGGAVVAKELAERGLDVLVLEAGARNADVESDFTHFENDQNNPSTGVLRFGPADRAKPPWHRDQSQNSVILQSSGVGGTTTRYYGNSPRAMPGAFVGYQGADAAAYDTAHLFPFTYTELVPYYEWVEATLPVQTAAMGRKEEAFLEAAAAFGLPHQTGKDITGPAHRPQENAILQPARMGGRTDDPVRNEYPSAQGCTFCGHCLQGCFTPRKAPRNLKAKRSTDNSYIPMALTADEWADGRPITLVTDAFALSVDTDAQGRARGVTWRQGSTGDVFTEDATVVVMAAGAIETPRLWLNSGLPNTNDWVGRGLTDHTLDMVVGVMPHSIGASVGPASAARVDYPGYGMFEGAIMTPALAAQVLSLSDSGFAGIYGNGSTVGPAGADGVGRLPGPALKATLAGLDHLMAAFVIADDDVEAQNRVRLSTQAADEHGPVAAIDMRHRNRSARTLSNREFLAHQAAQMLRTAGATSVHRANWPSILLHIHSSMRMGLDAATSVLDDGAEAREVPGLFIADNSALANGVGGPNPTLTTQAVATRTAEKIFARYFGGDPWVATGAPVSSIDRSVTDAVVELGL